MEHRGAGWCGMAGVARDKVGYRGAGWRGMAGVARDKVGHKGTCWRGMVVYVDYAGVNLLPVFSSAC